MRPISCCFMLFCRGCFGFRSTSTDHSPGEVESPVPARVGDEPQAPPALWSPAGPRAQPARRGEVVRATASCMASAASASPPRHGVRSSALSARRSLHPPNCQPLSAAVEDSQSPSGSVRVGHSHAASGHLISPQASLRLDRISRSGRNRLFSAAFDSASRN